MTYTFLFTDVEGSTRRWQADPDRMSVELALHDQTLRETVQAHRGFVFKHTGDGIGAVFAAAADGVRAALEAQRRVGLPVRMALNTGDALRRGDDFFGVALSRCVRLLEAGHAGQVLLCTSSAGAAGRLGPEVELRDLGEHRLRDLAEPERIFQVVAPGLPHEFPPLRSLEAMRHNLPVLRSAFVGREPELNELCERLLAGQFVTLTGIGGCGKTRLALEAASRLLVEFPQGVFFVDLAVVSDPGLVAQAVASALWLHLLEPSAASLAGSLAGRRLLVVLDNCEHLLDACAELVGDLLARCPELHVLATSREALGLDGERVFRVPSLTLKTDAVTLFLDRASAAGEGPSVSGADEQVVDEICRRLDGIPLAIELAAARTTHLAAAQILERLSDRFGLLTGGRRRVQRQQTLSAAIGWSHDLLSDREQTLFRRLAVFRGSFSLQAVEDICYPHAVDLLGSLVAKSLVNLGREGAEPRYRLLETVRLYAEERLLASGEAVELRCRHRDWLLAWLESLPVAKLVVIGAGGQLVPEADNLSAALDWSLEQGRLDLVARMASRMVGYWFSFMRVGELASWWRVLEGALPSLPADLQGQARIVGVEHALAVGDFQEMERLTAEVLRSAPPGSWTAALAWARRGLYWVFADPERGRRCIEEGLKSAASAGVPEIERMVAALSAYLLTGDPEHDAELGGRQLVDGLLANVDDAASMNADMLLGIAAALGDTDRASRLAPAVSATTPLQRFGREFLAVVIATGEGRADTAAEHLRALVEIVREYAIPLGEETCLLGFAAVAVVEGEHEKASRQLAAVRNAGIFPFRTPLEVLVYRQTGRAISRALDRGTVERCRAEGAATTVHQALDAALEHASLGASPARTAGPASAPRSAD